MSKVLSAEVRLGDHATTDRELRKIRARNPRLVIQIASLGRLPCSRAVAMIAEQTLRARETGAMIAVRPELDLLLRLAGTAQISEALRRAGYKARGKKLLVAAGAEEDVERMRRDLERSAFWLRILEGDELDDEGRAMVERAALLGARS